MDTQTAMPEAETDTLAADLAAAMDHIDAGGKAPDEPALEIDTQDDAVQPADQTDDREGQPQQATPDQAEAPANADGTAKSDPEAGQEQAAQDTQQETDHTATAPSSWTREAAGKWSDLPADVKAEIHRRETEYHKGIEQYKPYAQLGQEYERVVGPNMDMIKQAGVQPAAALEYLFNAHRTLTYGTPDQKREAIARIARDCQIDLEGLTPAAPVDPQVQRLMQERQQLRQFQHDTLQQQNQAVVNEIQAFAQAPGHEHFEAVKQDMSQMLQSGMAQNLQDAYDKAVWMRPDIRQSLVQRTDAQKTAEQQRQARAKSAAGSVKGAANPKATTLSPDASLRDTLNAAMDGNL